MVAPSALPRVFLHKQRQQQWQQTLCAPCLVGRQIADPADRWMIHTLGQTAKSSSLPTLNRNGMAMPRGLRACWVVRAAFQQPTGKTAKKRGEKCFNRHKSGWCNVVATSGDLYYLPFLHQQKFSRFSCFCSEDHQQERRGKKPFEESKVINCQPGAHSAFLHFGGNSGIAKKEAKISCVLGSGLFVQRPVSVFFSYTLFFAPQRAPVR